MKKDCICSPKQICCFHQDKIPKEIIDSYTKKAWKYFKKKYGWNLKEAVGK